MYVCMYVYVYVYTYIYIYTYIHIDMYTHNYNSCADGKRATFSRPRPRDRCPAAASRHQKLSFEPCRKRYQYYIYY